MIVNDKQTHRAMFVPVCSGSDKDNHYCWYRAGRSIILFTSHLVTSQIQPHRAHGNGVLPVASLLIPKSMFSFLNCWCNIILTTSYQQVGNNKRPPAFQRFSCQLYHACLGPEFFAPFKNQGKSFGIAGVFLLLAYLLIWSVSIMLHQQLRKRKHTFRFIQEGGDRKNTISMCTGGLYLRCYQVTGKQDDTPAAPVVPNK